MEINGLPLHPLVVHATVILVPAAAALALAFAGLPAWRDRLRLPTALGGVLSLVLVQVTVMTGEDLKEALDADFAQLTTHEDWAMRLRLVTIAFAVLAVLAAWLTRQPQYAGVATTVALGVLALAAVAVLVVSFLTGEAGARAVWG